MSIREALLTVRQKPDSIQAWAGLVAALEQAGQPNIEGLWEATIAAVASRGEFFTALALSRKHLEGAALARVLTDMAEQYARHRWKEGERVSPPTLEPWDVDIPESEEDQRTLAVEWVDRVHEIGLPEGAKFPYIPIFGDLTEIEFVVLATEVEPILLKPGRILIKQGEEEKAVYLLSHGSVHVHQTRLGDEELELAEVESPALLGEISALAGTPRRATVEANKLGLAWKIHYDLLARLTEAHPQLSEQFTDLVKNRLVHNVLRASTVLKDLTEEQHEALLIACKVIEIEPESTVFKQGESAPGLFIVLHGEAEVWTSREGHTRTRVNVLYEGDLFGEISMLSGQPTTGEVLMIDGGVLLHLPVEMFELIKEEIPTLEDELRDLMKVRIKQLASMFKAPDDEFETVDASWLIDDWD